ncbi:MAG: helix-turn-helix domain-containing protein, partial [Emergencia sp.]
LDCNSEIKATAEALFVHRNTILYRLNKIRSLLGCDLKEMPMAYDIYLAAAIQRIFLKNP